MATGTFSPGTGATFPVDGQVSRNPASEIFTTIRTSAGDTAATGDIAEIANISASTTTDQYDRLARSIFCFDTTTILSGNIITAGTLQFYVTAINNGLGGSISVVLSAPAST